MFDLEESCAGTGYLNCFCGGDNCVCHMNGGMPCDGCADCRDDDDDDDRNYCADDYGCEFPGECLMPGYHIRAECHTAEMMEKYEADAVATEEAR